jgi:thiol:disulfide interchange protein
MFRIFLIIIFSLLATGKSYSIAENYNVVNNAKINRSGNQHNYNQKEKRMQGFSVIPAVLNGNPSKPGAALYTVNSKKRNGSLKFALILFIQSLFAGLLAVFTPYIYTILPFTVGYLSMGAKSKRDKTINVLYYAFSLIIIFTSLGLLISTIIRTTGLERYTEHWLFNLFFFRVFLILGISFLGAFSFKLPSVWINSIAIRAGSGSFKGIFYMALTLPGASFSSTGPIIGLVLVLSGVSVAGPVVGLLGFAAGLSLPFIFPGIIKVFASSRTLLNNIKVVLGFFSLLIAMNFLRKADISFGLHLLDRDLFIVIWILLAGFIGVYMLGKIKMLHDYETEYNIYRQEYISIFMLFIAIAVFTFALYLLPGLWGAPLHAVNGFLPQ